MAESKVDDALREFTRDLWLAPYDILLIQAKKRIFESIVNDERWGKSFYEIYQQEATNAALRQILGVDDSNARGKE
jgi:hypothetical protein